MIGCFLLLISAGGVIGGIVIMIVSFERVHPFVCTRCDYDLRGTTADRCPECGTPRAMEGDKSIRLRHRLPFALGVVLVVFSLAPVGRIVVSVLTDAIQNLGRG